MSGTVQIQDPLAQTFGPDNPRCDCPGDTTRGMWVFRHDGQLFSFRPSTQMQKDIWLREQGSVGPVGFEARIAALRWVCNGCGQIQLP